MQFVRHKLQEENECISKQPLIRVYIKTQIKRIHP